MMSFLQDLLCLDISIRRVILRTLKDGEANTNIKGGSHCLKCGSPSHWVYKCPQLSEEQQAQLHMTVEGQQVGDEEQAQEGHQLLNGTLGQGGALPDDRASYDGCLTVTAFKSNKYLQNIKAVWGGIKIKCNAGSVATNPRGTYRRLKVWYLPDGIVNIFLMHELKKANRITYSSWDGYYIVHTLKGEVQCYKGKQCLPYIDLDKSNEAMAMMQLQQGKRVLDADESVLETEVWQGVHKV